jgi:hypothetical protein
MPQHASYDLMAEACFTLTELSPFSLNELFATLHLQSGTVSHHI